MGLLDFFKGKSRKKEEDTFVEPVLSNMKAGWYVDYDLKTWKVEARHYYDWGGGYRTDEWQLKSHDDTLYLACDEDDDVVWSICRKVPFGSLGKKVRRGLDQDGEPPDSIEYDGVTYHLDESSGGRFFEDGKGPGERFIAWEYWDDSEKRFLSVEQWGEDEYEAAAGEIVEEYQFTNILPGA